MSHESARIAVRDWLAAQVPQRLMIIRDAEGLESPPDPRSYILADTLPDNDPGQYPCAVISSTRTVGMSRRCVADDGDTLIYDVDYEVTVLVAVIRGEFIGDEAASRDRDRLLQAVRESLMERLQIADGVTVLTMPTEATGAASQTLRGQALAAGTSTVVVRCVEALIPTVTLAAITGHVLTMDAHDATTETL